MISFHFLLFMSMHCVDVSGAPGRPLPEPPQSDGSGPDNSLPPSPQHNNAT